MPDSHNHNVFISHRHEDDALVGQLKNLLRRHGAEVRDSSVTTATPNRAKAESYVKEILADRIQWAGKMIVVISPPTSTAGSGSPAPAPTPRPTSGCSTRSRRD